jgi:hypothetical protein
MGLAESVNHLALAVATQQLQNQMTQSADSATTHSHKSGHHQSFWLWVMCLTGVDYFSTLGYQPSIAYVNAGLLAPLATIVLIFVTLFGAYPVYAFVARCSHEGQGSIGMLANLVSGWGGKVLVLTLLGFAATDYVITKTLSAADAAKHMIENPHWPWHVPHLPPSPSAALGGGLGAVGYEQLASQTSHAKEQILVTSLLLMALGAMFMRGFREVIGIAVILVAIYLVVNAIVIGAGLMYVSNHFNLAEEWWVDVVNRNWHIPHSPLAPSESTGTGLLFTFLVVMLIFPKLALGLSGFETGVAVMPLVKGDKNDDPKNPEGRIRNTRKLLLLAALIMSTALFGSSLVVSILIPPNALLFEDPNKPGEYLSPEQYPKDLPKPLNPPKANERALAYLAHNEGPHKVLPEWFNGWFGTLYDATTVLILWFAGASAMAGLLNLVPKYLPRYGMAPEWARAIRPLVFLLTAINLLVTFIFEADVTAQGDAYATGVLVLITSACVATMIEKWRSKDGTFGFRLSIPYLFVTIAFIYTTGAVVIEKPVGMIISLCFIGTIMITSFASRLMRSRELRFAGFKIKDPTSKFLWDTIRHLELTILVPHRPGRRSLAEKEQSIRREHRIPRDLMIVFVEVDVADASDFLNEPEMDIYQEEGRYIIKVTGAASIANTLAAVALEMAKVGQPPEIHFGWTDETPWSGTLGFLLFGEGNVPWMVRELIRRAEPEHDKRPLIIIAGA